MKQEKTLAEDKAPAAPSKGKKAWNVISTVLVFALLAVAVSALCVSIAYRVQGQTLTVGGKQWRIVLTGSMEGEAEDSIRTHSLITVRTVPEDEQEAREFFAELEVGDIITFYDTSAGAQELVVTHRITEIRQAGGSYAYVTKGDANATHDAAAVLPSEVIGVVTGSNYAAGAFLYFLTSRTGIVVFLIVPAALIMIYEIFNIARMVSRDRQRKREREMEEKQREIDRLRKELKEMQKRGENNE